MDGALDKSASVWVMHATVFTAEAAKRVHKSWQSKMAAITGSRNDIRYISACIHCSDENPLAIPMISGSYYTIRLMRRLRGLSASLTCLSQKTYAYPLESSWSHVYQMRHVFFRFGGGFLEFSRREICSLLCFANSWCHYLKTLHIQHPLPFVRLARRYQT